MFISISSKTSASLPTSRDTYRWARRREPQSFLLYFRAERGCSEPGFPSVFLLFRANRTFSSCI